MLEILVSWRRYYCSNGQAVVDVTLKVVEGNMVLQGTRHSLPLSLPFPSPLSLSLVDSEMLFHLHCLHWLYKRKDDCL